MSIYFQTGPVVGGFFSKKILKVFPFGCHPIVTRILHGMKSLDNFEGDHPRIIPVEFGEIPPRGVDGNVVV